MQNKTGSREASRLADELVRLLESIGDPTLTVALSLGAMAAKYEPRDGRGIRLAQMVIDVADGDARKGICSLDPPWLQQLVMRGVARLCLGRCGWRGRPTRRHRLRPCIRHRKPPGCDALHLRSRSRTGHCCWMRPPFATPQKHWKLPSGPVTTRHCSVLEPPPGCRRSIIRGVRTVKLASSCWERPASEAWPVRVVGFAVCRHLHRTGEGPARRHRWCIKWHKLLSTACDSGGTHFDRAGHECLGGGAVAARRSRRFRGCSGRDQPAGSRADRSRFRSR